MGAKFAVTAVTSFLVAVIAVTGFWVAVIAVTGASVKLKDSNGRSVTGGVARSIPTSVANNCSTNKGQSSEAGMF
jgi:hypothetical protein